jgi:hypothetical protein
LSTFSWDNIANNLQENALEDKKSYKKEVDTRFWTLSRDENENGGAVIRFIPDPNLTPFIKMSKINATKGKKQFFVEEWSPESIGLPDPFREKFWELWNKNERETAKQFGRKERYITNIKVLKDPANPENEGKFFLFDMSKTLFDKIKAAMIQTEAMVALGEEAIDVYDPLVGHNFILKSKLGSTNIITYEDSKFADKPTAIYKSEDEALADIKENTYELKEFLQPEFYKSYDELLDLRDKFSKEGKYAPEDQKSSEDEAKIPKNIDEVKDEDLVIKTGFGKSADKETVKETSKTAEPVETAEPEKAVEPEKAAEPVESGTNIDEDLDSLLAELG